jgi:NADP-dependent 3-hydroxy acid dehydrogenase YdfG
MLLALERDKMTFDKDYIAVITGACGGIGESVAHALAKGRFHWRFLI